MAFDAHTNLYLSSVATAPSPATSGTSLVLKAGDGASLPAVPFNAVVWPVGVTTPTKANSEFVRVTAVATDTCTITRAQEGSTARSIIVGDQFAIPMTVKSFTDIEGKFPVAVADGGTSGTTLLTARAVGGLGIDGYVLPGDADRTGAATDVFVAFATTLTAIRTYTMPTAVAAGLGHRILVGDVNSVTNGYNLLQIARNGTDTINGGTSALTLSLNAVVELISDGVSNWIMLDYSGTGSNAATASATFDFISPLTIQGDVMYRSATTNARLAAGTSGRALITGGSGANPAWGDMTDVQAFTASQTWTKPANAKWVRVICIGSGGGGGGARLGLTGVIGGGGGGGAAGNWVVAEFQAADLTSTVTVTIPAGGAAGLGKSGASSLSGGAGGSPAATTFGTFLSAAGGGGGGGGTNTAGGAGGTGSTDFIMSAPWVTAAANPASGPSGGVGGGVAVGTAGQIASAGSGAAGGGISAANASDLGAAGGGGGGVDKTNTAILTGGTAAGSTGASGGAGQNSGVSPSSSLAGGSGGGSGAAGTGAANTTQGGAGGAGGTWGAGGGGGGAGTTNGTSGGSGAGGAGGKGYVIVITYR